MFFFHVSFFFYFYIYIYFSIRCESNFSIQLKINKRNERQAVTKCTIFHVPSFPIAYHWQFVIEIFYLNQWIERQIVAKSSNKISFTRVHTHELTKQNKKIHTHANRTMMCTIIFIYHFLPCLEWQESSLTSVFHLIQIHFSLFYFYPNSICNVITCEILNLLYYYKWYTQVTGVGGASLLLHDTNILIHSSRSALKHI